MDGWLCLWMDGLMDASICSCIDLRMHISMHVCLYVCDYMYGISGLLLPSGGKRQAKFGEGGGGGQGGGRKETEGLEFIGIQRAIPTSPHVCAE